MEDLIRPDEQLEAKEFEEATKSKWQRPQLPQMPKRPKLPRFKVSELDWAMNKWVIGLVLILIVLFGGRWVHHVLKNDDTKKTPVAVQTVKSAPQPAAVSTTPTTPTTSAAKPTQTPTEVPNTGPGDTAAIFIAASTIAAGAHYVIRRNQSAQSS